MGILVTTSPHVAFVTSLVPVSHPSIHARQVCQRISNSLLWCLASRPSHLTLPPRPQLHTSRDAAAPMLFRSCRILSVDCFDSRYYTICDQTFLTSWTSRPPLLSLHYFFASPQGHKSRFLSVTFHSLGMSSFFYYPACAYDRYSTLCSRTRMTTCSLRYHLLYISPDC